MTSMERRAFLKCGACALVALAGPPRFLVRTAAAAATKGTVLVAVFQRGAVDGLSMVMPYGDPGYAAARSSIALQPPKAGEPDRAVDLDGFFALHPALTPLVHSGRTARSRSSTRAARPTRRAPTSTRKTTWSRGRRA